MNPKDRIRHALARVKSCLTGRKAYAPQRINCRRLLMGSYYGCKCICQDIVTAGSIVYSFGVGQDVSFDLEMIQRFGASVFAFDPTSKSVQWLRSQSLPKEFAFHEYGLADFDGTASFNKPRNEAHVSYTIAADGGGQEEFAVLRFPTILKKLGHDRVDILKMDIEGAEYKAIPDILASGAQIKQMLIEFHHGCPGYSMEDTAKAVGQLMQSGFRIFYVSPDGNDYSFVRANALAK